MMNAVVLLKQPQLIASMCHWHYRLCGHRGLHFMCHGMTQLSVIQLHLSRGTTVWLLLVQRWWCPLASPECKNIGLCPTPWCQCDHNTKLGYQCCMALLVIKVLIIQLIKNMLILIFVEMIWDCTPLKCKLSRGALFCSPPYSWCWE